MRVGLTGGVASGKSTVADLFAALGADIIDTDRIAREVVAPGSALLQRVVEHFGPDILQLDGSLDRRALRARVFADPQERAALEGMLHPAIRAQAEKLAAAAQGPYQIHVVPLLVETGAEDRYDRVAVVDCDEATQLARLRARDDLSADEAHAMLRAQAGRAARRAAADDIIDNSGPQSELRRQIETLHRRYLELAAERRQEP